MQLPFTPDQFLDVFGSYNQALWPGALALWMATVLSVAHLLTRGVRASVAFSWLLAVHWAWAGSVYHLLYFRRINPAALVFGVAFIAQAVLFAWYGGISRSVEFEPRGSWRSRIGVGLLVYAVLYPALNLAFGLGYPRIPTFGVPCPSTILTIGGLMLVRSPVTGRLAIVPLLWSAVGGSAAFLFAVRADLALVLAGILLLVHVARPARASLGRVT